MKTFVEVRTFLGVFMFFVVFMTLLYINTGMVAPTEDYPDVPKILQYFLYSVRQSNGDLNAPDYSPWSA